MITPPRNGALSIRSGKGRSPRVGKCENIEVPVRLVIYQSNRGYIGEDHVVYEVKKADIRPRPSVTIAVTPPSATSPTRKIDQSEKI